MEKYRFTTGSKIIKSTAVSKISIPKEFISNQWRYLGKGRLEFRSLPGH